MKRVAFVFTGGTIATMPDAAAGGNTPILRGAVILDRAPAVRDLCEVEAIDWGLVPASHLRFGHLIEVAALVDGLLARDEIAGAVIVQGTDTMEETAFAFALLVRSAKPVVVTGAMRDSSAPDFDGARNLADAAACAVSEKQPGSGAVVVMNGLVLAAEDAVKTHPTAMGTFQSRSAAPLGRVARGKVQVEPHGVERRSLPRLPETAVEDVHLITAATGMDGTLLHALLPSRPAGVVIAATGTGNTSAELLEAAARLVEQGSVVALTTRCPTGVAAPSYAFPGGGVNWMRAGALLSALDGPRTRVALALGIGAGLDGRELGELIA